MAPSMKFCKINLSKTNYDYTHLEWAYLSIDPDWILELKEIYKKYCEYKNFSSVMPLFDSQFTDPLTDVLGFFDNNKLVAFSLVKRWDDDNAESMQFAWDYQDPDLNLGIRSLEAECALYKSRGYKYLYLGEPAKYKSQLDGYELVGKL
jgi:hypothetical protein